jgi:hypothetical protein
MIKNTFLHRDGKLTFHNDVWSVGTEGDLGFTTLKVGAAEFLKSGSGGFLFEGQEPGSPLFTDLSNLSHDAMVGHQGVAGDGKHMVRFSNHSKSGDAELYFGVNVDGPVTLKMFLSDEVAEIKTPGTSFKPSSEAEAVRAREVTLVHRDGKELKIEARGMEGVEPLEVTMVDHPAGGKVAGVLFHGLGFKPNAFRLSFGAESVPPPPIKNPRFAVVRPDDPPPSVLGAARGVGNPVYEADTQADFGMEFEWEGEAPFVGYAELEVVHSLGQPHFYERVDLTGRGPGQISAKFSPKFSIPGVSEVWMRLVDGQGSMLWNDRYRMAYALEDFQPDVRVEPDFKTFWDETLAEMRKLPLNPTTERVEKYKDFPGFEVYEVSFDGRMGRRIYAVMYVPRDAPRPLPVMVTAHPGIRGFGINKGPDGLFGSQFRPDSRFLTIVPLIRGHRPDAEDIPFSPPWWGPMESREEYVARDWYAALVRTNDYLASRPDLADMTRIVVAGGSQGGAFAIVTAALDPRVAYCFADCPAMGLPHEMMKH